MVEALIRNPSAALVELVIDPVRRREVVAAIQRAVLESFKEDARRSSARKSGRTRREEKRRASMCLDLFERLVGEAGWSPVHFRDSIVRALRAELDGGKGSFDPSKESLVWAPS
jgi:hypothetical protein